ncbi:hypothetical protein XAP412_510094 [Xanthomonas phaseoli pv. phaseoli]|uniref:Uncharacterized protein n=1 Tax=Xanthomonas campestris pv. phaseoli TaxID=317013 RepID=A0AB38E2S7_XANCH|nr:hypothetical protein XAP6984_560093 [Xanthomonas phaseoli pv. phaseoli]SON87036.1 hypothetical protein XAP412_510094 [Xanthomonas phaseoli pv. phaseoli]SON91042.1 hypothetical protein XAP7430_520089 [Xanthomonas phaseoli pv. phaseoli]SOO28469.1 hypothetical protein XAP6164_2450010 [Xanthomonas phaseoli pv. phaseoli]
MQQQVQASVLASLALQWDEVTHSGSKGAGLSGITHWLKLGSGGALSLEQKYLHTVTSDRWRR